MDSNHKNIRLSSLILFFLASLLYVNTIPFDYALDDKIYITHNQFIKKGLSGIGDILTEDLFTGFYGMKKDLVAGGRYRPLTLVTFAIEHAFFGQNPYVSHFINVALYGLTAVLLFLVLSRLVALPELRWGIFSIPFAATVIFAIHPLHTEVVANIKGREDLLCLLFSLWTMHLMLRWLDTARLKHLALACLLFLLAIFSKETAVTFAAIIPLSISFFTSHPLKKNVTGAVFLLLMTAIYAIVRLSLFGPPGPGTAGELMNNPFAGSSTAEKFATISYTWGLYLKLLLYPAALTHDYYPKQIPIVSWADMRAVLPAVLYSGMLVYGLYGLTKKSIVAYAILFFLASFSVVSNVVFPIGSFMNERFMYIPSIGFSLAVAYLTGIGVKRVFTMTNLQRNVFAALLLLITIAFGIRTLARNGAWRDDYTLSLTDVKTSANSAKAHMSAGLSLLNRTDENPQEEQDDSLIDGAVVHLKRSLGIYPQYTQSWALLGNAYAKKEQYDRAVACYDSCLSISRFFNDALHNLLYVAQQAAQKGQHENALKSYQTLLKYHPDNADYYNRLGEFYGRYLQNTDMALEHLFKANGLKPGDWEILRKIGVAYGTRGEFANAIAWFLKAHQINPNHALLNMDLSITYGFLGDSSNAIGFRERAQQLDPSLAQQR